LCTAEHLVKLALVEAGQIGRAAARVSVVDLDEARNKELLFLVGLGFPVVGLAQGHHKAHVAGPLLAVRVGRRARERFDGSEIVEEPCLPDREGAVGVLLGLVHAHAA
jgi:hypothetical protein